MIFFRSFRTCDMGCSCSSRITYRTPSPESVTACVIRCRSILVVISIQQTSTRCRLRVVTVLYRRAISAAGPATRPARRRLTAHARYRRRRQTTAWKKILVHHSRSILRLVVISIQQTSTKMLNSHDGSADRGNRQRRIVVIFKCNSVICSLTVR